jgi:hypothetical protein
MPKQKKAVAFNPDNETPARCCRPRREEAGRRGKPPASSTNALGIPSAGVATILAVQAAAMPAVQGGKGPENAKTVLHTAIEMLEQIKPEGALQSMLAVQMIGVHNTAVKFLMRASDEDQTFEGRDANVLRATRLMRVFNEQLQAFASLRGKTSAQKVTVEHVHVYPGGQAIVGNVKRGEGESNGN